jgi:hypothetical protein
MSAMALIVRPVRPNVGFIVVGGFSDGEFADAIVFVFIFFCYLSLRFVFRFCDLFCTIAIYLADTFSSEPVAAALSRACAINQTLAKQMPKRPG